MTDLLTRDRPRRPGGSASSGATVRTARGPALRAAVVAGVVAAGSALLLCMAVGIIGWFATDAGAHGSTVDALRAGAQAWLAGQGATLDVGGTPLSIIPLALTGLVLLACWRSSRWAAGRFLGTASTISTISTISTTSTISTAATTVSEAGTDGVSSRTLLRAGGAMAATHTVIALLVTAVTAGTGAGVGVLGLVVGSLLLSGTAGGLGLAAGAGRLTGLWEEVPGWVRAVLLGAARTMLLFLAAGAVTVAVGLLWHLGDAARMLTDLHLGVAGGVLVCALAVLVVPNAAVYAVAWLLGPGFSVGVGTIVSPTAVQLGALPAFPLLAALPHSPPPAAMAAVMAVPVVLAAVGAGMAQRDYAVTAWDSAALRAFGSGCLSALALWLLGVLAGGGLGTGRMTDIGPVDAEVLVVGIGGLSIGGLVGGLAVCAWQRRALRRAGREGAAAAAADAVTADGDAR